MKFQEEIISIVILINYFFLKRNKLKEFTLLGPAGRNEKMGAKVRTYVIINNTHFI